MQMSSEKRLKFITIHEKARSPRPLWRRHHPKMLPELPGTAGDVSQSIQTSNVLANVEPQSHEQVISFIAQSVSSVQQPQIRRAYIGKVVREGLVS